MKRPESGSASRRVYGIGFAGLIPAAGFSFPLDSLVGTTIPLLLLLALLFAVGGLICLVGSRLRAARREPAPPGTAEASTRSASNERQLEPELETLNRLGLTLAGQLDIDELVKAVTDAGIAITGAAVGAFVSQDGAEGAGRYVSGAPSETCVDFSLPRDAEAFGSVRPGAVGRSDDLPRDPRYGRNLPFEQMPPGAAPALSYLAAPVRSRAGELLGGLFFGHPEKGFFREREERLLAGLAATAAIALDNARLYRDARQARAAADAANGVKDEFLATLSHELRTPLSAIAGWAELLHGGRLSADETVRAVEAIIRNADAQTRIVDELLDVARITTGKLQLDMRPVDLASVVEAAIGTVTPAARAKGIRLQLIQNPAGSYVMGDPERLQQVFWNLLSNAIKFTPRRGWVRVSVEFVDSSVEVVVADSGPGIDAAFLLHAFDRFTQEDSSSTRTARGLGLGLSIARHLVELHGGSIRGESPGVGQGCTFAARFPRCPVSASPPGTRVYSQADEAVGLEADPDLTGIRVLVVDDDQDARALIEKVLQTQGAAVETVASARAALDVLGRERVDVLLSDIEMPVTDGYQLIRELRRRPTQQGGAVPAAALTAWARTEDRLRALRAGFQLHLSKPVQASELVTVVDSLAARRKT